MLRISPGANRVVNQVLVAFGANLGHPVTTFRSALDVLVNDGVLVKVSCSPIFSTRPVGGPTDQPDFGNAVVAAGTTCGPRELMLRLLEVERGFGRDRDREVRWGPRHLDLDLIAFADLRYVVPGLELPHPRARERAFVLGPARALPLEEIPLSIREIVRSFPTQWPKEQSNQEVFLCS